MFWQKAARFGSFRPVEVWAGNVPLGEFSATPDGPDQPDSHNSSEDVAEKPEGPHRHPEQGIGSIADEDHGATDYDGGDDDGERQPFSK